MKQSMRNEDAGTAAPARRLRTRRRIAIGIAVVVALFCIVSFAADRIILNKTFERHERSGPSLLLTYDDIASAYPREDVEFQIDGHTLRGHVYGPANDDRGLVVFRHGIFSQHQDYLALITALVDKGWKVFAYDALGCGESDGDTTYGMPQSALDVRAAIRFAQQSGMAGDLPIMLFGHSWGGYGVAATLEQGTPVRAVVSMSGFDDPVSVLASSAQNMLGPLAVTQRPFLWLNNYMDFGADANISATDSINAAADTHVLVIGGTGDKTVPFNVQIASQGERLTNEHAAVSIESQAGRDGHNDYFYSPKSQAYLNEKTAELEALEEQYPEGVPEQTLAEFMASVDKHKANTADPELIEQVNEWFARAAG